MLPVRAQRRLIELRRQLFRTYHVGRHVVDLRLPCHLRVGFPVHCGPGIGNLEALGQISGKHALTALQDKGRIRVAEDAAQQPVEVEAGDGAVGV